MSKVAILNSLTRLPAYSPGGWTRGQKAGIQRACRRCRPAQGKVRARARMLWANAVPAPAARQWCAALRPSRRSSRQSSAFGLPKPCCRLPVETRLNARHAESFATCEELNKEQNMRELHSCWLTVLVSIVAARRAMAAAVCLLPHVLCAFSA